MLISLRMASLCRLRNSCIRCFPSKFTFPSSVYGIFSQYYYYGNIVNRRTLFSSSILFNQAQTKLYNQSISLEDYFLDEPRLKSISENDSLMDEQNSIINIEAEHLYAYHELKNILAYSKRVNPLIMIGCNPMNGRAFPINYGHKWPKDLPEFLLEPKNLPQYDENLKALNDIFQAMSFNDIIAFQKYLQLLIPFSENETDWKSMFLESNLFKIWNSLDEAASRLLERTPLNESLYQAMAISSLWYELGLLAHVRFNRTFIYKLLNYNQDLEKLPFLHLMYSLSVARSIESHLVDALSATTIAYLNKNDDLNLEDLSLVAMGFFKTQTKMPHSLLSQFIPKSTDSLKETHNKPLSIPATMIIKCIRFSIDRFQNKNKPTRKDLKAFADIVIDHSRKPLECNICLAHFMRLLDSSYLFNYRKQYIAAFERLLSNAKDFRIKDIDRILHCFAKHIHNFRFSHRKLKRFERELMKHDEKEFFPYYVYNIANHLLKLQYCPYDLLRLCCKHDFLAASIGFFGQQAYNSLLIAETQLRLISSQHILTPEQIYGLHRIQLEYFKNNASNIKKELYILNFSHLMRDIFGDKFRLMNVFPFTNYPVLVVLNDAMAHRIKKQPSLENIFENADPFELDHLKPNFFRQCIALVPLVARDFHFSDQMNDLNVLQKRLLQILGFRIIYLEQKDYPLFVFADHVKNLSPQQAQRYKEELLNLIEIRASDAALRKPPSEGQSLHNEKRD